MKKLQIILMLAIIALLSGCGNNDKVVNLGLLLVPNDAILAKELGLFEEKFEELGYDVEYYPFDSGTAANTAILADSIDFATMGNINGLIALGTYLETEMIWIHETLGEIEALAVRESLNLEEVADLATISGMTIATPFSSTAHYILLNALQLAGIEEDVTLVSMTTAQIKAAWAAGTLDAAYTWQPSLGDLLADGGEILISSQDMIELGYRTANIELVRSEFAEENPEVVTAYIECMAEAYEYYIQNETDAINKLAIALELTYDEVEVQINGSNWTSLEEMQDQDYITSYVDTMYSQTSFLLDQDILSRTIERQEIVTFLNNSYALDVNDEENN